MRTVGVSIAIPEPYFSQLRAMRRDVNDPQAELVPPHITLLPPTDVAKVSLPEFEHFLAQVTATAQPFDIILRGTGTFRPVSPVVYVQLAQGVSSCEQLERSIRSGPVARDLEFSYHPHVTIAHHLDEESLDKAFEDNSQFHARFRVDEIHLYFQEPDGEWVPQRAFPLLGG